MAPILVYFVLKKELLNFTKTAHRFQLTQIETLIYDKSPRLFKNPNFNCSKFSINVKVISENQST